MTDQTQAAPGTIDPATMAPAERDAERGRLTAALHADPNLLDNKMNPARRAIVDRIDRLVSVPDQAAGAADMFGEEHDRVHGFDEAAAEAMAGTVPDSAEAYALAVENVMPGDLPRDGALGQAFFEALADMRAPEHLARGLVQQFSYALKHPPDPGSIELRHEAAVAQLRRDWGNQYDAKLAGARRLLDALPNAALFKGLLVSSELGNNPTVICWLGDHAARRGF